VKADLLQQSGQLLLDIYRDITEHPSVQRDHLPVWGLGGGGVWCYSKWGSLAAVRPRGYTAADSGSSSYCWRGSFSWHGRQRTHCVPTGCCQQQDGYSQCFHRNQWSHSGHTSSDIGQLLLGSYNNMNSLQEFVWFLKIRSSKMTLNSRQLFNLVALTCFRL